MASDVAFGPEVTIEELITASSVWRFDHETKTYTRTLRGDAPPNEPFLPYPDGPQPFAKVEACNSFGLHRLLVTHPDGSFIFTGVVDEPSWLSS